MEVICDLLPFLLCLSLGINLGLAIFGHELHGFQNPLALRLYDRWSISVCGWSMRPVGIEHVYEQSAELEGACNADFTYLETGSRTGQDKTTHPVRHSISGSGPRRRCL